MSGGAVAVRRAAVSAGSLPSQHCREAVYADFVNRLGFTPGHRRQLLGYRQRFVAQWPDLSDWFAAPLATRVGRGTGDERPQRAARLSHQARGYLLFLGLCGYARFDYEWLLALGDLYVGRLAQQLGLDLGIAQLVQEAIGLGFDRHGAERALGWVVARIVLHTGDLDPAQISAEHLEDLRQAVQQFGERSDLTAFYDAPERYRQTRGKSWLAHLHLLQVVVFHRGQLAVPPRKFMPSLAERPPTPPPLQAVVDRWLAARRLTDRPKTLARLDLSLRRFLAWLAVHAPSITRFTEVTREHVLAYLATLAEEPTERTGQPLSALSRRGRISALSTFFRDTAAWGWNDVPGRPLLGVGDLPKMPVRVPRFIPADELTRLMAAIAQLTCPYQRAALLVARWSGARKSEIQRLAVDCLDRYPDGTPRLRLPAGKTYQERLVPLHDEAAQALQAVIALRRGRQERALIDELTGTPTRYLFMNYGKQLSGTYLFQASLRQACQAAGLVDAAGRPTVSAHRFRHTVGTQLAERGATLHTIMSVLGHRSASMSLVYAQISDREVLRDYQAVLEPGALIAGPGAEALRSGALPPSAIDWLKSNFFKTELELGHCLRLSAEGPCECDLYLTCAKFVTTPAYAPRLRERHRIELVLAQDAEERGWPREVERHRATAARIEQLLTDLGEPLEGPAASTCQ